jgi:TRAP-type uncharacterized transport system fused permease subunit
LGLAKVLVPFVFVFSPSLLLVAKGFTWAEFAVTFTGCVLGIVALAAALSGYMLTLMKGWERALCAIGALCLIAPGLKISLLGLALMLPVLVRQWMHRER